MVPERIYVVWNFSLAGSSPRRSPAKANGRIEVPVNALDMAFGLYVLVGRDGLVTVHQREIQYVSP